MKRKYGIYIAAIVLLALANLWRWLPVAPGGGSQEARSRVFLPEDFRLRVDVSVETAMHRDLFRAGGKVSTLSGDGHMIRTARIVAASSVPAPEQSSNADADFDRLKLLGVVFRGGKAHAYLALDKENVIALVGDTVLSRFTVDKIDVDAVNLRDLKTNISKRIPISGK